jgi:hypothetical protein
MGREGSRQLISELKDIKSREKVIKKELDEIKVKEEVLLTKLNKDLGQAELKSRQSYLQVMHFTFNDFAQATIGSCVFSFAPFLDTDPWTYLPEINTAFLFFIHMFFVLCVFVALNYRFRDKFTLDFWFLRLLAKRMFYLYFSVMMVMLLVIVLIHRITYATTLLDAARNLLAMQVVGLFGAITFSFLRK